MRSFILTLGIWLFSIGLIFAQRGEISTEERDHKFYSRLELQDAIKRYQKLLEKEPENGYALFNLANSYRLNSQYEDAEKWFEKASKYVSTPSLKLYYAQMLLAVGKYKEAGDWFEQYSGVAETPSGIKNAVLIAEYCDELATSGLPKEIYSIELMPFNSDKLDFSPAFLGDDKQVIFSSTREKSGKKSKLVDGWTAEGFVDLYLAEKKEDGTWTEPSKLPYPLNFKYHEGPLTFNSDYSQVYMTRNDHDGSRGFDNEHNTRLHIYSLERNAVVGMNDKKHWKNLQPVWFNSSEYSSVHPTLSKDGKVMVFASDKPGGLGHMDLYMTIWDGTKWGEPKNLGDVLNTSGMEVFPYIHPETNYLYFASNMHMGFGGLDLFKALWNKDTQMWEHPVNLGLPVNSPSDDFGIIVTEDLDHGYFTSNRVTETEDDIYFFQREPNVMLEGVVINGEDGSIISDADISLILGATEEGEKHSSYKSNEKGEFTAEVSHKLDLLAMASKDGFITNAEFTGRRIISHNEFDGKSVLRVEIKLLPEACELLLVGTARNKKINTSIPGAKIQLIEKCSGNIQETVASETGAYSFKVRKECEYEIVGTKEGFIEGRNTISTVGRACKDGKITADVILDFEKIYEGLVIELENIYYDFDKYFIRKDAEQDLERVYALMIEYPEMKGEIGAHTDSRGSFAYNDILSANRAKAAVEWLIKKGINRDRLTSKGYGEYQLRNECSDGVKCSKIAHQRNRRVEFKVTYFRGEIESKEKTIYLPNGGGDK